MLRNILELSIKFTRIVGAERNTISCQPACGGDKANTTRSVAASLAMTGDDLDGGTCWQKDTNNIMQEGENVRLR